MVAPASNTPASAFFSTPGIERFDWGETNRRPGAAATSAALVAAVAVDPVEPVEPDLGGVALAGQRALGAPGSAHRCAGGLAAERRLEKVAVVAVASATATATGTARSATAEPEAAVPFRRWAEGFAMRVALADIAVRGALLGIVQRRAELGEALEADLGTGLLADTGVVLARPLAAGALGLCRRRGGFDAGRGVIALSNPRP